MKIIVTILLTIFCAATAQEFVAGVTVRRGRAEVGQRDPVQVCQKTTGTLTYCLKEESCDKGDQYFTCINGAPLANKACADPTPYCSGDPGTQTCTARPGPSCSSSDVCREPGYFPDPANCYNYYYCYLDAATKTLKSVTKVCPTGYPFSPSGPQDRKCLAGGACVRASCTAGITAQWRAMNYYNFTNNRMALYCVSGTPAYVYQCPVGLSLDLTFTNYPKCAIKCVTNYQKAVYPADNTKYYQCLGYVAYIESCEVGQVFNAESLSCVVPPATTTTVPVTLSTTTPTAGPDSTTTTTTQGQIG